MLPDKTSDTVPVQQRAFIVGVIGSHEGDQNLLDRAFDFGQRIAERGYVLLTGGQRGNAFGITRRLVVWWACHRSSSQ
ncbi:MAG: hypothetical protein JW920_02080 [Deltaproteobacteria bacterium]|nr:hypothetical protein [Deltaproteobacteria bacterium]